MKWNPKKFMNNMARLIFAVVLLWIVASHAEILWKYDKPNPQYSSINMWSIIAELGTEYQGGIN